MKAVSSCDSSLAHLCPLTGQFSASGGGATAMVTYQDGQLVIQQVGNPRVYPDCRAQELHMCVLQ